MDITNFIKPELFLLIPVLWIIGIGIKNTKSISDKFIPLLLGACGVILAAIWVLATTDILNFKDALMAVFVGLTQGLLCAGASVYIDQLIFKQPHKED